LFSALLKLSNVEERFATALFSGLFILLILLANWANASATAEEAPGIAGAAGGISYSFGSGVSANHDSSRVLFIPSIFLP